MKHLIVLLLATISFSMYSQAAYEKGMQSAMGLWSEGKNSQASAMFERIAAGEKDNWLPNYYVALVNTTTAFNTKDKTQVDAMLKKAQSALDAELKKQPNHPELLVMQAMIHTAWITFDPMTNGMKLSGTVMKIRELFLEKQSLKWGLLSFLVQTQNLCVLKQKELWNFSLLLSPKVLFIPIGDRTEHKV